uniref:Cytochrome P450 CYP4C163 n=1 Tax=Chrysoperla zastrowi sillemi TaxID=482137 RepID=A0A9E7YE98_9NEOP|nr:cytochrome P450 CYP4C163 [Chrysoperla zastrowi sillemi]
MFCMYAVLFLIAAIFVLWHKNKNDRTVKLIEQFPGPQKLPIVGTSWTLLGVPVNKLFSYISSEYDRYYPGPYRTWLGPTPAINIYKPEHIECIVNNQKHITKGLTYNFLHPWLGQGLLTSSGEKWFKHRRMITPAFHFKILDQFVEVFFEKCDIMTKRLERHSDGKYFDIYPYITRCALDIICETAMGVPINAQVDQDSEYVTALYEVSDLTMKRSVLPWLQPDIIWNNVADGKRYYQCLAILHGFTNSVIKGRRESRKSNVAETVSKDDDIGSKKRMAFLDVLLEAQEKDPTLSDTDIREEVDTFMFEGHDTTTAAICWSLFMLGLHPEVQEKAYQEIKQIFQGSNRSLTKQDLLEMKYLEMVIKEALRLFPSVPIIGRVLKEDQEIDGKLVPKETVIFVNIHKSQRDPAHFNNPNEFNPDNFLLENSSKRHPYAYMPFSAGPRNCIGQKFALLEEKTIISTILRNFKLKSMQKMHEVNLVGSLVLRPEQGAIVSLEKRQ